ncbi:MAG: recombinase family protein [Proteobacteria bacterium]|nr:recombinase family protein [Pseudomonadota bacterium]
MSRRLRCAIYTRKSTEDGLDQDFNSLDAQREACEAYIASQAGEGWRLIKTGYDDGAYSGGTMERPALRRLLADIDAGKVDTVVVYKVDRLTRSLADFARIVELFDANDVSFVSITQQFNTTTSMGRLTLNMLLSFAQFEREVTGERIRDKIAASKRKGMWMGGVVPLGYDVIDRKLIINETEAETVRTLFRLYRQHANVRLVKEEADRRGLRTKLRRPNNGARQGGEPFTRGHIYKLLANPIYVGEIVHKGERHAGAHEAIIDRETWDAVQEQLRRNAVVRHINSNAKAPSLLAGMLFDEDGNRMVPSHASKAGRRYRYYVSKPATGKSPDADTGWRLPAPMIEDAVLNGIRSFLCDRLRLTEALHLTGGRMKGKLSEASRLGNRILEAGPADQRTFLLEVVDRIEMGHDRVGIILRTQTLRAMLNDGDPENKEAKTAAQGKHVFRLDLPVRFKRRGVEMKLVITDERERPPAPDPHLIAAVAKGRHWFAQIRDGEVRSVRDLAERHGVNQGDVSRILPLGLLAPDIVEAILAGRQPIELTAKRLKRIRDLPVSWAEQRRVLGFA